jgi:thioredoxin reductase
VKDCDVAIIGGGPAGLATAIELKRLGVEDVVVLERNSEAGGNPRHCGHSPFGMREFKRVYFGPKYAKELVKKAIKSGATIAVNTTVTSFEKGGLLNLSTEQGLVQLIAKIVVLSTGTREKPRSARLVTGQRPLGIMTAGALQSMVYLSGKKPFSNPVIIGSELVSFSAVATCRHANIKPVAMIEENARSTAWSFLRLYPQLQGVKFISNTRLDEIHGKERVTGVTLINTSGEKEQVTCDGVIFTGQFVPEATLARIGHLEIDTQSNGPVVDQYGRCSDPSYFATGNVLRSVETAGWCWKEGVETAKNIARSLSGELVDVGFDLEKQTTIAIKISSPIIKYCVPQKLVIQSDTQKIQLQIRLTKPAKGRIVIHSNGSDVWSKKISALPERRILLSLSSEVVQLIAVTGEDLVIEFQDNH